MATPLMGQTLATALMTQASAPVVPAPVQERAHMAWEPGQGTAQTTRKATWRGLDAVQTTRKVMEKSLGAARMAGAATQVA